MGFFLIAVVDAMQILRMPLFQLPQLNRHSRECASSEEFLFPLTDSINIRQRLGSCESILMPVEQPSSMHLVTCVLAAIMKQMTVLLYS